MPSISDKSTVQAVAQAFTSNGRVMSTALQAVGYSKNYSEHNGLKLFEIDRVKQAIQAIDDAKQVKYEHTEASTIAALNLDLHYLDDLASNGNIQAIQARTQIQKELNNVMGLNHTNVHTSATEQPDELTPAELAELRAGAQQASLIKLSKEAG